MRASRLKLTTGQINGLSSFIEKTDDKREYRRAVAVFLYDVTISPRNYTNEYGKEWFVMLTDLSVHRFSHSFGKASTVRQQSLDTIYKLKNPNLHHHV
ncbi:MAG: hypothetical protein WAJ93_19950 [Candidatus Nitrosopolaris sp.]|jgi:hypothetical protein